MRNFLPDVRMRQSIYHWQAFLVSDIVHYLGTRRHRVWCARVFAPALERRTGRDRVRLLAQLEAVCDVQAWHNLRRVSGLDREQTERALVELLTPQVEARR
jgi:hypothetical protein